MEYNLIIKFKDRKYRFDFTSITHPGLFNSESIIVDS